MGRIRGFRLFVTTLAVAVVVASLSLALGTGTAGAVQTPMASCTFNGHPNNSFVPGITPGGSISIACTGLPKSTLLVIAEASALAALVPSSDQIDEADVNAIKFVTSTLTGTLPPGTAFTVPNPFSATDTNAKCPPTQAQVNAGLVGCAVAVAELVTQTNFGDALLDYTGQPTPAAPTLALGLTTAKAGDQVSVLNGAPTGDWWGNAYTSTALSPSNITVGGISSAGTTATISAAKYPVTKVGKKMVFGPLTPSVLGGAFTVPCGASGHQTVTLTQPNTTPEPGTISATASLTVVPGTTPAVTALNPANGPDGGGTSVNISGCNFTGATAVTFGAKPATSFHVNSDTSVTAVSPAGSGTVHVVVTGPGGSSSATSTASAFKYGVLGYDLAGSDGGTFSFGDAVNYGSLPGLGVKPAAPVVGIAPTASAHGYWLVGADGGVYAFGDAKYYGSLPGRGIKPASPVVGIAATADGGGYWLVGADGGVYGFGDAPYRGSLPGLKVTPNKPVVGIVSPDNGGYWLAGADGGVYSFGDTKYFGSLGNRTLAAPIVGGDLA